MEGVNDYESRVIDPSRRIIDFQKLNSNPWLKSAVWMRYKTDMFFRLKVDEIIARDYSFKMNFWECFRYMDYPTERRGR